MEKNKIMNIAANIALAVAIIVSIQLADSKDASLGDMGIAIIIMILVYLYTSKSYFISKRKWQKISDHDICIIHSIAAAAAVVAKICHSIAVPARSVKIGRNFPLYIRMVAEFIIWLI